MELINIDDAIRAVDRHMLEDGTLDNDISCILEEVAPVMIPQKASSSCSHEKGGQLEPEEPFEKCSDCIHAHDSEDICVLRRCKHAIAETVECFEPKQPERKRGKWIYGEDEYGIDGYHCDKCGFFVPWDYAHKFINYIEDYNYCPNCGCRMEGEIK